MIPAALAPPAAVEVSTLNMTQKAMIAVVIEAMVRHEIVLTSDRVAVSVGGGGPLPGSGTSFTGSLRFGMIDRHELRRVFETTPFNTVRLYVSNGREYIVRRPQDVIISERIVHVGLDPDDDGFPTHTATLSVEQINSIEFVKKSIETPQEPGIKND